MAAENPNFSPRLSRLRESRNLSLFASVVTTTVFREMTEKNAHFTGKLQNSIVTGLMGGRPVCDRQQLGEGGLKNLVTSLSLRFPLLKLLSDKKKSANFFVQQTANSSRISRISGIIVRLANEKLTFSGMYFYSGISQTNAPLVKIHISCSFYEIVASRNPQYFTHSASEQQKKLLS